MLYHIGVHAIYVMPCNFGTVANAYSMYCGIVCILMLQ